MHIALITKPIYQNTGIGRYTSGLEKALRDLGHQVTLVYPIVPIPRWLIKLIRRWLGWDLEAFFLNYPLWAHYPKADVYHFTSQNLATLMLFQPPTGPVVVTVHDIIPYLMRNKGEAEDQPLCLRLFDRLANQGIRKAQYVVCDSTFTQINVIKELRITNVHTRVVPLGINHRC